MSDLSSFVSGVQSPTCTICREHNQRKETAFQTPRKAIWFMNSEIKKQGERFFMVVDACTKCQQVTQKILSAL